MGVLQYDQVAKIKVIGVGGGGCNAVNRMVEEGVKGVEFFVANTDQQVLNNSVCEHKIILGQETTKGLGAGGDPEMGRKSAIESEESIKEVLKGADMVFIAAGLGGGTGTGAAPIIAKIAKEQNSLVVGIVTKPFSFEGKKRMDQALSGLEELRQYIDSLIIVSNNQLLQVIGRIPLVDAFREADNVLRQGVQTITDLIAVPAFINLDFADVKSVMKGQGSALIGIGLSKGEDKAREAAEKAIHSPLLEAHISGAKNAIVNVTGGNSISLFDANDAVESIRESAGNDVNIIFGIAINENLGDEIIVTVIATGFDDSALQATNRMAKPMATARVRERMEAAYRIISKEPVEEDIPELPGFFKNRLK